MRDCFPPERGASTGRPGVAMTQLILVIWRHSGIVDERMQRAVEKPFFLADKTLAIGGDAVGPVRLKIAFGRYGVARTGDDPASRRAR